MPKFFVLNNQISKNQIEIKGDDVNHIRNVLRMKENETIEICNKENGKNYLCKICSINDEKIQSDILQELEESAETNIYVEIFQGLPKFDKMEYIIQKSVELGASKIHPIEMKRCIVKLNEKDKVKKELRWQKISEVAAKQCGRNIIPQIEKTQSIKILPTCIKDYDIFLVAYENEKENLLKNEILNLKNKFSEKLQNKKEIKIGIVIGPEGGLEKEEVQNLENAGAKIISLGRRILRTETVALNVLSILMYELEN